MVIKDFPIKEIEHDCNDTCKYLAKILQIVEKFGNILYVIQKKKIAEKLIIQT